MKKWIITLCLTFLVLLGLNYVRITIDQDSIYTANIPDTMRVAHIKNVKGKDFYKNIYVNNVLNIPKPSWDELYSKLNLIAFSTLRFNRGVDEELKEEIKEFRQKEVKDVITKLKKKIYANSNEILKDNFKKYKHVI